MPGATRTRDANDFGALLAHLRRARRRSQLALALDAEVSQRHLSYLECGRARPSREMILRLGDALDLPLRERNRLLVAAGFTPWYPQQELGDDAMRTVRHAIERLLAALEPSPSLLIDAHWRLLDANTPARNLLGRLLADPSRCTDADGVPNVLRATFLDAGLRPRIRNWTEVGPYLLARVRRDLDARPDDAVLAALLADLEATPGVRREWNVVGWQPDPLPVLPMELVLDDGAVLRCYSMITAFGSAADVTVDELHIESFVPVDADSARLMERLANA